MSNKKLEEKNYYWNGANWVDNSLTTYYWSETDIEDGITETIPLNNSILIYPNPVSTLLNIKTENPDIIPNVKIYSIQGSLLLQTKGNQIDVSALPSGVYIVEIDGVCRKIVKQ
jgi:hypothetical protein